MRRNVPVSDPTAAVNHVMPIGGATASKQVIHDLIYAAANRYAQERGAMDVETVVVHPGPRAWKTVSLLRFLDTETGEVRGPELQARTWRAIPPEQGGGYDFKQTEYRWHCEGEHEIEALRLFLNREFPATGRYRLIQKGSEFGRLVDELERGDVAASDVARLIQLAGRTPGLISGIGRLAKRRAARGGRGTPAPP